MLASKNGKPRWKVFAAIDPSSEEPDRSPATDITVDIMAQKMLTPRFRFRLGYEQTIQSGGEEPLMHSSSNPLPRRARSRMIESMVS